MVIFEDLYPELISAANNIERYLELSFAHTDFLHLQHVLQDGLVWYLYLALLENKQQILRPKILFMLVKNWHYELIIYFLHDVGNYHSNFYFCRRYSTRN